MGEDGLLSLEKCDMQPTSQKFWFSLWLNWNLKGNSNSNVGFGKSLEEFEIMGEGGKTFLGRTKTKELMEDNIECKYGITPFGSLILRSIQGCRISIALNNSSFASFLLNSSSFLFNSLFYF